MKSTTKYLIGVVAVVLIIASVTAVSMLSKPDSGSQSGESQTHSDATPARNELHIPNTNTDAQQGSEAPKEKVTPTFMYFVSKNDAAYDAAKAVFDELSAEYKDKVKFELKDVDAEPDLKERFMINLEDSPIPMKTPTLIMLDTNNDISTIGLSECTDKATLKAAIDKALGA